MAKKSRGEPRVPVERARDVLKDPGATRRLLDSAERKAKRMGKDVPRKVWKQITLLRRMLVAYVKGQYRGFPLRTAVLATAALLYFVNPFDLIPDWIAGFGLIDDATVIAFVLNSVQSDVDKFRTWERSKSKRAKTARASKNLGSRRRSPTAA